MHDLDEAETRESNRVQELETLQDELLGQAREDYRKINHLAARNWELEEALRVIAGHQHPYSCDGFCADSLIEIARDGLVTIEDSVDKP
ncbi:MAG: hypothetical protein H0U53_03315 [Actinobacteria bacterium]|nr:hypothetical protein [Actinomycetota bacterium]